MKNKELETRLQNTFKYTIEYDNYFDNDNENGTFYTNERFEFEDMLNKEIDFAEHEYGEQWIDFTINEKEHSITVMDGVKMLDDKMLDYFGFDDALYELLNEQ